VTKEQIDALVKSLDRLGLGTGDRDAVDNCSQQETMAYSCQLFRFLFIQSHIECSPVPWNK